MSFAELLTHALSLVTPTFATTNGETSQTGTATVAVNGLVQPRSAEEIAALSQAGAEVSTHVVFLELREIAAGTWITDAAGRRYDITGIRRFEYGSSPHLEVDASLVTP